MEGRGGISWQFLKVDFLFFRKDVRLPVHLQRAMATEAEAAREARAKVSPPPPPKKKKNFFISISPGDRSWGGTEGQQCSEAGSGGHSAVSSCPAGQERNIWESIRKYLMKTFQLRYLQTLNSISAEHNSTIIFPMPMTLPSLAWISSEDSLLPLNN